MYYNNENVPRKNNINNTFKKLRKTNMHQKQNIY